MQIRLPITRHVTKDNENDCSRSRLVKFLIIIHKKAATHFLIVNVILVFSMAFLIYSIFFHSK